MTWSERKNDFVKCEANLKQGNLGGNSQGKKKSIDVSTLNLSHRSFKMIQQNLTAKLGPQNKTRCYWLKKKKKKTWQFMLAAVLAAWNRLQCSVRKSEHTNQSFKVLTKISQVDLFLTLTCTSDWKQRFVGQPPSGSLGAGCVNDDSCLQQDCSCRDLHNWTPWPEVKCVFSQVSPEILPNVPRERLVSAHKIHNFCAKP